ncbi:MAG: NifB/NifX family molybdenum-iron cluster-binding protein [Desulfobacterales bacterium]|nr:NifB/NifX family molybdenum-iron cluster-binding protein [Desulfobacterales bacterium]
MARTFIFIKDVEHLLRQGKTEMQLPEGSRFSPAAWDLIREKNIRVSFTDHPLPQDEEIKDPDLSNDQNAGEQPQLAAIVSASRKVSGTVGENAVNSPFYLLFDHDGKFIDVIKNPFRNGGSDADQKVVNLLAASQVTAIAARTFSEALRSRLTEKNIRCFEVSGAIEEAVKILFQ